MDKVFENARKVLEFYQPVLKIARKITNLQHQILGCELHQNAFGGRAPLGARTHWGSYSASQIP